MSDSFDPYKEWLGIEPNEQPVDHYRLLSLNPFESDTHVISVAADQRMSHIRSFQTGPRGKYTQPLLNAIAIARRTLIDDRKRAEYDEQLREDASLDADIDTQLPPGVDGAEAAVEMHPGLPPTVNLQPNSAPTVELNPPPGLESTLPPTSVVPPSAATEAAVQPPPDLPTSMLPEPSGPPLNTAAAPPSTATIPTPPSSATGSSAGRSGSRPTSVMRERRKKSNSLPMIIWAVAGVAVVAGAVWAVGTFWNGRQQKSNPQLTQPKSPPKKKKKGLQRKVVGAATRPAVEVMQEGSGDVNLKAAVAGLHGPNIQLQARGKFDVLSDWKTKEDWAQWRFKVFRPGIFQLTINYQVPDGGGGSYEILLNDQRIKETATRNGAKGFVTDEFHLPLRRKGSHVLVVRPTQAPAGQLMILKFMKLVSRTSAR